MGFSFIMLFAVFCFIICVVPFLLGSSFIGEGMGFDRLEVVVLGMLGHVVVSWRCWVVVLYTWFYVLPLARLAL